MFVSQQKYKIYLSLFVCQCLKMCSRYLYPSKQESIKSLLTICVEYLLSHVDSYCCNFPYLPVHIKNRILKRLTSVHSNFSNIAEIFGMLVHSQLKYIDFCLYEVDNELLNVISNCCNLQELLLTRNKNSILAEEALVNIFTNFNSLQILQVENCFAVTDNVTQSIVQHCPNLSEIDIAGCRNISDLTLREFTKLPKLQALNISRTKITNVGIKYFVTGESVSIIKELRIAECGLLTPVAINLICEKCKSLEVFVFNNSGNSDDKSQVNFENDNLTKLKQLTWTVYW